MKRGVVTAVVLVGTVAGASVAEGAVEKGKFTGKTKAGDPVGFTVPKTNRVSDFFFEGVHLTCSDGDEFDTGTGAQRLRSPAGKSYKVNSKRRFSIKVRNNQAGNGWDIKGKFNSKGKTAAGTLTIFATFDDQNQADPQGSVKCTSGKLPWTATRK
jgi:hypothetical protein